MTYHCLTLLALWKNLRSSSVGSNAASSKPTSVRLYFCPRLPPSVSRLTGNHSLGVFLPLCLKALTGDGALSLKEEKRKKNIRGQVVIDFSGRRHGSI